MNKQEKIRAVMSDMGKQSYKKRFKGWTKTQISDYYRHIGEIGLEKRWKKLSTGR